MSNTLTKRASVAKAKSEDEMPPVDVDRIRVRGRGSHKHRRLELPLAGIRKAVGKTQVQVAEASGLAQGDVSRLENQEDMRLSTLRRYAEALGAPLEIAFTLPNGVRIYLAK